MLSWICCALGWSHVLADEHEANLHLRLNPDWHGHLKEEITKYINSEKTWGKDQNLIFSDHTISHEKIFQREPEKKRIRERLHETLTLLDHTITEQKKILSGNEFDALLQEHTEFLASCLSQHAESLPGFMIKRKFDQDFIYKEISYWLAKSFYHIQKGKDASEILAKGYYAQDLLKDFDETLLNDIAADSFKKEVVLSALKLKTDVDQTVGLIEAFQDKSQDKPAFPNKVKKRLISFASGHIAEGKFHGLLQVMKSLDDLPGEEPSETDRTDLQTLLLYYQAESYFRLGDHTKAGELLLILEMMLIDSGRNLEYDSEYLLSKVRQRLGDLKTEETELSYKGFTLNKIFYENKIYIIFAITLVIISIILFYKLDLYFQNKDRTHDLERQHSYIQDPAKVTSLEDMRKQDGRVSQIALQQALKYHEQDPKVDIYNYADKLEGAWKEELRYANLIIESHKMIHRLNSCLPYPLRFINWFINKCPFVKNIHSQLLRIVVFSLVFSLFWGIYKHFSSEFILSSASFDIFSFLGLLLTTILLVALLNGIRLMAFKTLVSMDKLTTMIETKDSLKRLESWIKGLLLSPWQFFIALILCSFYMVNTCLQENDVSLCFNFLFIFVIIFFGSTLVWFITRSFSLTSSLCKLEDLEQGTNPLSPLKTLGLQKWITVIGTYAVVGSLVLTYGATIKIIMDLLQKESITLHSGMWMFIFIPLLVAYWIFPYFRLSETVKSIKMERMHFLKTLIVKNFQNWKENEENISNQNFLQQSHGPKDNKLHEMAASDISSSSPASSEEFHPSNIKAMDTYYNLFQKLDKSPESFVDFSAFMELAKIIGLPSLIVALVTYLFM